METIDISAVWGWHGGGAFPDVLLGGHESYVRVDRKSSVQEILPVQITCFRTPESAQYNLHAFLRDSTLHSQQLRRTGASLAYYRTNHSSNEWHKTHQPFLLFLKQPRSYYRRVAVDTVCFQMSLHGSVYPLSFRQTTSSIVCSSPSVYSYLNLYKTKIDLAVPGHLP